MANLPNSRPSYQGKALSTQPTQGQATNDRAGKGNTKLMPRNEPPIQSRPINPRNPRELQNPNRGGVAT